VVFILYLIKIVTPAKNYDDLASGRLILWLNGNILGFSGVIAFRWQRGTCEKVEQYNPMTV
jgi:hypothetical protein